MHIPQVEIPTKHWKVGDTIKAPRGASNKIIGQIAVIDRDNGEYTVQFYTKQGEELFYLAVNGKPMPNN